jgi:hypothetical protein
MSRGFIPRNDGAFDTFFKLITQYVGTKTSGTSPAWTHIPQARITALNADYSAWYTAFSNTFRPTRPLKPAKKNRYPAQPDGRTRQHRRVERDTVGGDTVKNEQ